jgi:hypothetical protein
VGVETTASGLQPGAIQEPSIDIVSDYSPSEKIALALQDIALRELDALGEEIELKSISKKQDISFRRLGAEYVKVKARCQQAKQIAAAPELTPEQIAEQERAAEALKAEQEQILSLVGILQATPDLLPIFHQQMIRSGYICELKTAASVWLSHGARLLPDSTAFFFNGASASGKSALVLKGAAFLPQEIVLYLTSFSEQAIFYLGGIQNKYLVFGEIAPTADGQDDPRQSAMRQLLSENKITRGTVEKVDGKSNEITFKMTEGPCVMVATTTREAKCFYDELQNRGAWVTTNDSTDVTKAVLSSIADRAMDPVQKDDAGLVLALKAFQEFHRRLQPLPVVIPFAHAIKITNTHVTARRLFPMLLNYVRANALLHQHCREKRIIEGQTAVVATHADYELAYQVVAESAPRVLEMCPQAARNAFDSVLKPALTDGRIITTAQAVQILQRPDPTVRRWLKDYVEAGLLTPITGRDYKSNIYALALDAPEHFTQSIGLVPPGQLTQPINWKDYI